MSEQIRSRDWLKDHGYIVDTVERWITFPKKDGRACPSCGNREQIRTRQDAFGCVDIIAAKEGEAGTLYVQATSYDNMMKRVAKSLGIDAVRVLLKAGNRFHVHGWRQQGGAGSRWRLRCVDLYIDDFGDVCQRLLFDEYEGARQTTIHDSGQPTLFAKSTSDDF